MEVLIFVFPLVLIVLWLAAESTTRRWLRISAGLAALIVVAVVAHTVGSLSEFNSNAYFARANTTLLDAAIADLDRGNADRVKKSLIELRASYHPNYENRSRYTELVDDAVKKMSAPSFATSPEPGR